MEKLREHLGIEKWHVFGGSWVGLYDFRVLYLYEYTRLGIHTISSLCAGTVVSFLIGGIPTEYVFRAIQIVSSPWF